MASVDIQPNLPVGRQEAARIRRTLHRLKDSELKLPSGSSSTAARTVLQKATSRLNAANISESVYRKQLEEAFANLESTRTPESEVDRLRLQETRTRQVLLLLQTLNRKESIRSQRFSEIRILIDELRKSLGNIVIQPHVSPPKPMELVTTPKQTTYLRDTLISAYGYHAHLLNLSRTMDQEDPIPALRASIARSLCISEADPRVDALLTKLVDRAKLKVRKGVSYQSVLPSEPSDGALATMSTINKLVDGKRRELQELSDLTTALIHLSYNYIDSTQRFNSDTSRGILESLLEESSSLCGKSPYVDTLRNSIMHMPRDPSSMAKWISRSNLKHDDRVNQLKDLIARSQLRLPPALGLTITSSYGQPSEAAQALIAKYKGDRVQAEAYIIKLLERKGEKVVKASKLVQDAEKTIQDGKSLVGGKSETRAAHH